MKTLLNIAEQMDEAHHNSGQVKLWVNPFIKLRREPEYSLAEVLKLTGVAFRVLRSWIDRKILCLDADSNRQAGSCDCGRPCKTGLRHRRFSHRDVELIRRVYKQTRHLTVKEIAARVADHLEQWPYEEANPPWVKG